MSSHQVYCFSMISSTCPEAMVAIGYGVVHDSPSYGRPIWTHPLYPPSGRGTVPWCVRDAVTLQDACTIGNPIYHV